MSAPKAYYVTTPIYYVNDSPHIGHAYTTVACDVLARFMRLDGLTVKFLTGTDEHGQKVENAALEAGETPQNFVDRVSQRFRDLRGPLGFTNDDFIRTTEDRHVASVQQLWREMAARDEIYLGAYEGWYSVRDEAFYTEAELIDGKAPTGAPEAARAGWRSFRPVCRPGYRECPSWRSPPRAPGTKRSQPCRSASPTPAA